VSDLRGSVGAVLAGVIVLAHRVGVRPDDSSDLGWLIGPA